MATWQPVIDFVIPCIRILESEAEVGIPSSR